MERIVQVLLFSLLNPTENANFSTKPYHIWGLLLPVHLGIYISFIEIMTYIPSECVKESCYICFMELATTLDGSE